MTEDAMTGPDERGSTGDERVLARVVFPTDGDVDVLPLYVDGQAIPTPIGTEDDVIPVRYDQSPEQVLSRRSYRVDRGTRASFATYFNAFPAGYWRRWSTLTSVKLRVRTTGAGTLVVYRSSGRGISARAGSYPLDGQGEQVVTLPLDTFSDGGWYWFDLAAGTEAITLEQAEWVAGELAPDAPLPRHSTISVGVTTFNRPGYCANLIAQLGNASELDDVIDTVFIIEQGTDKVRDHDSFAQASAALGERLRIVEQPNLGGSGGFSRSMLETLDAGRSDHVLLLDDDVVCEPEGIVRAVTFSDFARQPIIVGGLMFSMYERSTLHALAERVTPWRFRWLESAFTKMVHDLSASNLRSTPWLHRRAHADYNGWWMCLIPTEVLSKVGLSLPLFIKWDDAEFGIRASEAGFPTVSLPGAAVWHVPWTDKDDATDWQAYYHARNRLVAALLHSPFEHGGRIIRDSVVTSVKHVVAMQYSAAALRHQAVLDVLSGPDHLHRSLPTSLRDVRAVRSSFGDANLRTSPDDFPPTRRTKPNKSEDEPSRPDTRLGWAAAVARGVARQFTPVPASARTNPEREVAAADAGWWTLGQLNSAVVSTMDGKGLSLYQRDRRQALSQMRDVVSAHQQLLREWPVLAEAYRSALPDLVGVDAWRDTLDVAAPSAASAPTAPSAPSALPEATAPSAGNGIR